MAGPPYTVAPLWNDQRTAPVAASSANIVPFWSIDPAKTTPLTVASGPLTLAPLSGAVIDGLATCHSVSPVAGSSAAHDPTVVFVGAPASLGPPRVYAVPDSSFTPA